jgi:hypothetical protein
MRLNLPPQGATDRLREPYHAYLLEFILRDKKPQDEPVLRLGNMPLPDQGEQAVETVLKVQYGGNFGHSPSDPSPACRASRGGACPPSASPSWAGRAGRR